MSVQHFQNSSSRVSLYSFIAFDPFVFQFRAAVKKMAAKLCRSSGHPEPNPAQIDIPVPRLREIQAVSRNNSNSLNSSSASPGPSGMTSRKATLQTICGNVDSASVPSAGASQKGTIQTIGGNVDSQVLPSSISSGLSATASRKGTLQAICGNVDNVDSPVLPSNVHVCEDRPHAQITEVEIAFGEK